MLTWLWHELKFGWKSWLIWTLAISAFVVICVAVYPDMNQAMSEEIAKMYSSLGAFGDAFGLDKLQINKFLDFYGLECGTIIGLGGAIYAAILGIGLLAKEESQRTAEFLFAHPVSRIKVIWQKILALLVQILALHLALLLVALVSIRMINQEVDLATLLFYHLGLAILSVQVGLIAFGVSAFLQHENLGAGVGFAVGAYFLNIVINLKQDFDFLKFLTPFYYIEASRVLVDKAIDWPLVGLQMLIAVAVLAVGVRYYQTKDLRS